MDIITYIFNLKLKIFIYNFLNYYIIKEIIKQIYIIKFQKKKLFYIYILFIIYFNNYIKYKNNINRVI